MESGSGSSSGSCRCRSTRTRGRPRWPPRRLGRRGGSGRCTTGGGGGGGARPAPRARHRPRPVPRSVGGGGGGEGGGGGGGGSPRGEGGGGGGAAPLSLGGGGSAAPTTRTTSPRRSRPGRRVPVMEMRHARPDRREGQPAVPRRDDVRRLGQHRPRRVDPDHPPRARRGDQLHRHRRRVLPRRVRGDRRQGARGRQARQRGARDQGPRHDGRRPQRVRQLAPLDHPRGGEQPAPAEDRLDRPLPDPPPRAGHRHRRDARRAHRPRPGRQGALHRQLDVPALGRRRGAVGGGAPRPRAVRVRAAAVLDPRARGRARPAADLPALRHGRDPVVPARGRLAVRQVPPRDRRGAH